MLYIRKGRIVKPIVSRWVGHGARMGDTRNAYRILVEERLGKFPLARPRKRWMDNIKKDIREVDYEGGRLRILSNGRPQY
jgi:hypothetical protein